MATLADRVKILEAKVAKIERHQKIKVVVTIGVLVTTIAYIVIPHYTYLTAGIGVVTNLFWIWEE